MAIESVVDHRQTKQGRNKGPEVGIYHMCLGNGFSEARSKERDVGRNPGDREGEEKEEGGNLPHRASQTITAV